MTTPKSFAIKKFDTMLKEMDEEYRTNLINFAKYKLVIFTMAKIMEMEQIERDKVALYLLNIMENNKFYVKYLHFCK